MRRATAVLIAGFLLLAAPVLAQDKKVDVNVGAGFTMPISEVKDHLGNGYNVNFGVTFNVTKTIGIQGEYSFTGLGEKQVALPSITPPPGQTALRDVFARMNMQYGDINIVFKPAMEGRAKPYIVAGIGVYYRPVKVTTPGAGYVPPYCDPWFYWCYPGGLVPVDYILGEASSTDFGMDFGGGVDIAVTD